MKFPKIFQDFLIFFEILRGRLGRVKSRKIEGTQFCSRIRVQATVVLRFWGVFDPRLVPCVSVLYDSSSSLRTKKVLSLESYMETTTQFGRRTRTKLVWSVLVLLRDSSSSLRTKKVLSLQSYMETTTQFGRRTRTKLVWSVLVLPAALFFQISRVVGTDHTKSVLPILERRGQKHPKIGELQKHLSKISTAVRVPVLTPSEKATSEALPGLGAGGRGHSDKSRLQCFVNPGSN